MTKKTKAVITADLGGIVCNYDEIFEVVERKRDQFKALDVRTGPLSDMSSRIQKATGRIAVIADCAHSLGASRIVGGKRLNCSQIADMSSFSLLGGMAYVGEIYRKSGCFAA